MNEDFPPKSTNYQRYQPAMSITDPAEADAYFEKLVCYCMKYGGYSRAEAESIERQNLGYYAGYGDAKLREQVERVFKCSHPIFGSIAKNGQPTPAAAFHAGTVWGDAIKRRN